jgi:hypothetical protein
MGSYFKYSATLKIYTTGEEFTLILTMLSSICIQKYKKKIHIALDGELS